MSNDARPKTKKLRQATPHLNLPIINSQTNKFNWKTLSESNVYILKKLPEVSLKDQSLNQLDQLEFNERLNKTNAKLRKELIKQNSTVSSKKDAHNLEQFKQARSTTSEYQSRPTSSQRAQAKIKCYLCNNEFNSKEIIKHETSCLDKWRQLSSEDKKKAIDAQKNWLNAQPNQPSNQQQWKKIRSILSRCPKCGKSFFMQRLEKHELDCKGRQISAQSVDKLSLDEGLEKKDDKRSNIENLKEIIFVRKTKPLTRSTKLYKQQKSAETIVENSSSKSPEDLSIDHGKLSKLSNLANLDNIDILSNLNNIDQQNWKSNSPIVNSSETVDDLTKKTNTINQAKQTTNYFEKCTQCGRVCNKSNMDTHIKIHKRSNLIPQSSEDNTKLDKSDDKQSGKY